MKRLLIAAGAVAATTLAIEKVIEYAFKQERDEEEFMEEEPFAEEVRHDEFINLNHDAEDLEEDLKHAFEEAEDSEEEQVFDAFIDEAGEAIKEVGNKVREFVDGLPKISVTINVEKKDK